MDPLTREQPRMIFCDRQYARTQHINLTFSLVCALSPRAHVSVFLGPRQPFPSKQQIAHISGSTCGSMMATEKGIVGTQAASGSPGDFCESRPQHGEFGLCSKVFSPNSIASLPRRRRGSKVSFGSRPCLLLGKTMDRNSRRRHTKNHLSVIHAATVLTSVVAVSYPPAVFWLRHPRRTKWAHVGWAPWYRCADKVDGPCTRRPDSICGSKPEHWGWDLDEAGSYCPRVCSNLRFRFSVLHRSSRGFFCKSFRFSIAGASMEVTSPSATGSLSGESREPRAATPFTSLPTTDSGAPSNESSQRRAKHQCGSFVRPQRFGTGTGSQTLRSGRYGAEPPQEET